RASGMVPPASRRDDAVRGEPAKEVPGHLPVRLRFRGLAVTVGGTREHLPLLDRTGRTHVPRRQPAHEGLRVLGMGDHPSEGGLPRRRAVVRGVYATSRHVPAREARLHAVVYVLRLAILEARVHRVHDRADADGRRRLLQAELLAQYAGHPDGTVAERTQVGL